MFENTENLADKTELAEATNQEETSESQTEDSPPAEAQESAKEEPQAKSKGIDWKKAPKEYASEYKKLQAEFTRRNQEYSEFRKSQEKIQTEYEQAKKIVEQFNRVDELFRGNETVREAIQKALNPEEFQRQKEMTPVERELAQMKQMFQDYVLKPRELQEQEATLDKIQDSVSKTFKQYFGRDAQNSELAEVLRFMADNGIMNGEAGIRAMMADKIAEHKVQEALNAQKSKRRLGTLPGKVNSAQAKDMNETVDFHEAFRMAREETGFQ